ESRVPLQVELIAKRRFHDLRCALAGGVAALTDRTPEAFVDRYVKEVIRRHDATVACCVRIFKQRIGQLMAFKAFWNGLSIPDAPGLVVANASRAGKTACAIAEDYRSRPARDSPPSDALGM